MRDKADQNGILLHGSINGKDLDQLPKKTRVFILEGRPNLTSSQYLVKHLNKGGITPILIADNMAGYLFYQKLIKEVRVGIHDFAEDGVLAPIGALILAVLAKKHKVPFKVYMGEKVRTFIGTQKSLMEFNGVRVAPRGTKGYVPLIEFVSKQYLG